MTWGTWDSWQSIFDWQRNNYFDIVRHLICSHKLKDTLTDEVYKMENYVDNLIKNVNGSERPRVTSYYWFGLHRRRRFWLSDGTDRRRRLWIVTFPMTTWEGCDANAVFLLSVRFWTRQKHFKRKKMLYVAHISISKHALVGQGRGKKSMAPRTN